MANFTGIFDELKKNYESLENSLKTITNAYQKTILFFDTFFTWIPPEVIILFIFSVLLLVLINNLSPSTPRANLTFSTILLCLIWGYLNHAITGEIKIFWIFKSSLYIMLPVYFLTIFEFILHRIFLFYKKRNKISAKDLEDFIPKMESAYHNAMSETHKLAGGETNSKQATQQLDILIEIAENLKIYIAKKP